MLKKYIVSKTLILCCCLIPFSSIAYDKIHTGRVASATIIFYEDNGTVHGMVVFKDKKGEYVSIISSPATITIFYYCKEISSFTNRPDTNAYREEKGVTVKSRHFKEITLSDGAIIFGVPIFRYDGVPWFSYDMNWYKLFPEIFYDKERICKKAALNFNCMGVEAEGVVKLYKKDRNLKTRISNELKNQP